MIEKCFRAFHPQDLTLGFPFQGPAMNAASPCRQQAPAASNPAGSTSGTVANSKPLRASTSATPVDDAIASRRPSRLGSIGSPYMPAARQRPTLTRKSARAGGDPQRLQILTLEVERGMAVVKDRQEEVPAAGRHVKQFRAGCRIPKPANAGPIVRNQQVAGMVERRHNPAVCMPSPSPRDAAGSTYRKISIFVGRVFRGDCQVSPVRVPAPHTQCVPGTRHSACCSPVSRSAIRQPPRRTMAICGLRGFQ